MTDATVHVPVLPDAVREAFTMPPGVVVDATGGGGGHTAILLELGHRVIACDRDPRARARLLARFSGESRLTVHAGDFRSLPSPGPFQGLLADLGLSSDQLDSTHTSAVADTSAPANPSAASDASVAPETSAGASTSSPADRGFSFLSDAPPDMRMDPSLPQSAADLIEASDLASLARILKVYGEEPRAARIARALVGRRFTSARELAAIVNAASGYHGSRTNPATRTFQALRIAVNDELGQLEALLEAAPRLVEPGGRIAVIAFHSLEDRLVKRSMAEWCGICRCPPGLPVCGCGVKPCAKPLWKGFRSADDREVADNPRARSAHIRGVVRV